MVVVTAMVVATAEAVAVVAAAVTEPEERTRPRPEKERRSGGVVGGKERGEWSRSSEEVMSVARAWKGFDSARGGGRGVAWWGEFRRRGGFGVGALPVGFPPPRLLPPLARLSLPAADVPLDARCAVMHRAAGRLCESQGMLVPRIRTASPKSISVVEKKRDSAPIIAELPR